MKTKLILAIVFSVLLIGGITALGVTSIARTNLTFNTTGIVSPTKEPVADYATRMLRNVTISDIYCDKYDMCKFTITKQKNVIARISFKATNMTDKEILLIRDKQAQAALIKWLSDKAVKPTTTSNIGGSGGVVVKK